MDDQRVAPFDQTLFSARPPPLSALHPLRVDARVAEVVITRARRREGLRLLACEEAFLPALHKHVQ